MSIVFAGGGTVGPLTSVLNIAKKVHTYDENISLHFVAPKKSAGKEMVEKEGISWHEITSTKLHRYVSVSNLFIPLKIVIGFIQAYRLLKKIDAKVIVTSGGFVSPPVVWAGKLLRAHTILIQLDVRPGLANKLMKGFSDKIYVSWESHLKTFKNAELVGLPLQETVNKEKLPFTLPEGKKLVTIVGGGTGAAAINKLVSESVHNLTKHAFIAHSTGKGKLNKDCNSENYFQFEFGEEWYQTLIASSDIVVSRAGMGALADYIFHGAATIIIPIPNSHQVDNANMLKVRGAAVVLNQNELNSKSFAKHIISTISNEDLINKLKKKMSGLKVKNGVEIMAEEILRLYG